MTTTAEKIKVMQAFEDGEEIQVQPYKQGAWEDRKTEPPWNWGEENYRIKPPDPKPLECWANQPHSNGRCEFFNSPAEAMERVNSHKSFRRAVYMREVTPQDEENAKGAARYRKYKELARDYSLWWFQRPLEWDKMIDKAMESDERYVLPDER